MDMTAAFVGIVDAASPEVMAIHGALTAIAAVIAIAVPRAVSLTAPLTKPRGARIDAMLAATVNAVNAGIVQSVVTARSALTATGHAAWNACHRPETQTVLSAVLSAVLHKDSRARVAGHYRARAPQRNHVEADPQIRPRAVPRRVPRPRLALRPPRQELRRLRRGLNAPHLRRVHNALDLQGLNGRQEMHSG